MIQRQSKTRIKRDFIVPKNETDGEDHVIFYQDSRWKNGSMLFFQGGTIMRSAICDPKNCDPKKYRSASQKY